MVCSRKVIWISAVSSHPTVSGTAVRPVYLAKQLRILGYEPHFAYTDFTPGNLTEMAHFWGRDRFHFFPYRRGDPRWELKRLVRRLGLAHTRLSHWWRTRRKSHIKSNDTFPALDEYYDERMTPWLSDLQAKHHFDAVIAHCVIMSKALEAFPRTIPRILDSQELFAVECQQRRLRGEQFWVDLTPEEELKGLRRADFVWAIQQHEENILRAYLGDRVMTVSHFIDPIGEVAESSLSSKKILFVGANQPANVKGLRWFGKEVYPHLASWLPAENVLVVGNIRNALGAELPFQFLGQMAELAPIYREARLAICPIISGGGLKSKNVEAFAFSKPVVTTSFGRLGMEDADGRAHLAADEPKAFADAIRQLMTDDKLCRKMMHEALAYAREWNVRLREPMRRCLEGNKG
jgi:polysaccharide biosynthesis protein PslH